MAGKVHLQYDVEKKKAAVTVADLSCRLFLYILGFTASLVEDTETREALFLF